MSQKQIQAFIYLDAWRLGTCVTTKCKKDWLFDAFDGQIY